MIHIRLRRIAPRIWVALGMAVLIGILPLVMRMTGVDDVSMVISVAQPLLSLLLMGWCIVGLPIRLPHPRQVGEKALMIGSVVAVWFVAYFLSGLIVTYVHNAVATNWLTIMTNLLSFGVFATATEVIRYRIMAAAGRRNIIWFGAVVSLVFACGQMSLVHIGDIHTGVDVVKFIVADSIPAIASSFLLTYLAVTVGLIPQLVYRLCLVAAVYLPPIIPKYDWYLTGISALLLAITVYVVLEQQRDDSRRERRRVHHTRLATNIISLVVMVGLVLFMIGAFSYRPQVVMSNSMVPVFSRGAMVIVQKTAAVDVKQGDIIQYETPVRSITHRVISVDYLADGSGEKVFITKGDNSPSADPPVRGNQIVGVIRAEIPYIGYPTVWLRELIPKK